MERRAIEVLNAVSHSYLSPQANTSRKAFSKGRQGNCPSPFIDSHGKSPDTYCRSALFPLVQDGIHSRPDRHAIEFTNFTTGVPIAGTLLRMHPAILQVLTDNDLRGEGNESTEGSP